METGDENAMLFFFVTRMQRFAKNVLARIALYIEDVTCPRVDTNFIFECSTRYRYRVEYENIKFVSTSGHVIFCLLHKHADDDVFGDFPKISAHFPKILQKLSEGQPNVSKHCPKISEDTS